MNLQTFLNKVFPAYRTSVVPKGSLLTVDGIFGKHTERWIQEFQRRAGLHADGIVGATTAHKLGEYGVHL